MRKKKISIFVCLVMVATVFAVAVPGSVNAGCTEGMVSYWRFDEGSGATAGDSVGDNDGTVTGAAWTPGQVDDALEFDGVNDCVYVADSTSLHLGTNSFSLEMWLNAHTFSGKDRPIEGIRVLQKNAYPSTWWVVDIYPSGQVQMEMGDSNSVIFQLASTNAITLNDWYHIAIVVDRVNFKVRYFIDGAPAGEQPLLSTFTGNLDVAGKSLEIGSAGWNPFDGLIDEVALYNRALSPEEIEQHYNNGLAGKGYCVGVIEVGIDIKPGSDPNSINLGSMGVIPVAILTTENFDATQVDPETVMLAGAGVAVKGKGSKLLSNVEDVNGDGLLDLSLKVVTIYLDPGEFQDGWATLTGEMYDGTLIEGKDTVNIVPS